MAMAKEQPVAEASAGSTPSAKKMILIVGAILLFEAVAIVGLLMFVSGPAEVDAANMPESLDIAADERVVETLILDAKLPNARSGITYLYDTEIYVQSRQKHTELIQKELDQFANEIRAEITAIWRTSDPQHFQEARLENLTRKVHALLNSRLGVDPESGDPIVSKCVIVMGTGFRIDN